MAYLSRIILYPIKALDGVSVDAVQIGPQGQLRGDREFAIFDPQDRFVNGKNNVKVHRLRSQFGPDLKTVILQAPDCPPSSPFDLEGDRSRLVHWLREYFSQTVNVEQNSATGFPDDTQAVGPTVISTATLKEVATWFPGQTLEQMRRRFRANIEIEAVPSFWEDQLFGPSHQSLSFQIGVVRLTGINPCQRCVVPSRDPETGESYPGFVQIFIHHRQATLPAWTAPQRFNHYYKLSVNTLIPASEVGKTLRIGDKVMILAPD
jgi:uncharacterized protein